MQRCIAAILPLILVLVASLETRVPVHAQESEGPSAALKTLTGSGDFSTRAAAAMMWLADHQNIAGFWNPTHFDQDSIRASFNAETIEGVPDADRGNLLLAEALTSICVFALMESGSTTKQGIFAPQLQRALRWLVGRQQMDGRIGKAFHSGWIINHAWAMAALSRLQEGDEQEGVNLVLDSATTFLVNAQGNTSGRWGFGTAFTDDNTYCTALALMGLQANRFRNVSDADGLKKSASDYILSERSGRSIGIGIGETKSKLVVGWDLQESKALNAIVFYALDEVFDSPNKVGSADFNMSTLNDVLDDAISNINPEDDPWQAFEIVRAISVSRRPHLLSNVEKAYSRYVLPKQYGYRAEHLAKLPSCGSPGGRMQLREHGAWGGDDIWMGGRVLATATHALSLAILGKSKQETYSEVTVSGAGGGVQSVEWDAKSAGLSGTVGEAEEALWNLLAANDSILRSGKIDFQRSRSGKLTSLRSASFDKVIRTNDLSTMKATATGDVVFMWYETNASGTTTVAYIPSLNEERVEGEGKKWSSRFSSVGIGASDPRYPWRENVLMWFNKIPLSVRSKPHYAGLAAWLHRNYATFPFADARDPGHACWSGFSDEILYQGKIENKLSMNEAKYLSGFIKGNKEVAEGKCTFFHDSFLDAGRFEARKAVSRNPESFLSWYDAAFLAVVDKRNENRRWEPLEGSAREKVIASRDAEFAKRQEAALIAAE